MTDARQALAALIRAYVRLMETGRDRIVAAGGQCDSLEDVERSDPFLRDARDALAAQPVEGVAFSEPTVLPDGSAFAMASFPLPKDHWLYAPRGEWDNERDDFAETPLPILTNAQREAVIAAARYAIRGATMCRQETDFDPDAMALNFAYAMCGPARGKVLPADSPQAPQPAPAPEPSAQGEPVAFVTEEMVTAYLTANDAYWKRIDGEPTKLGKWRNGTPSEATRVSLEAALASAPHAREPLNFDRLQSVMAAHFGGRELTDDEADSAEAFARAVERAHGIG